MGRPPKDPALVASVKLSLRVTPAEHDLLHAKAREAGKPLKRVLLAAVLALRLPAPVPRVNRALSIELGRIGNNLNQLARLANGGNPVSVDLALLREIAQLIRRVRAELHGESAP